MVQYSESDSTIPTTQWNQKEMAFIKSEVDKRVLKTDEDREEADIYPKFNKN